MTDRPQDTLLWRKAKASASGNCVEVAANRGTVFVRDSKFPDGPSLAFSSSEWLAFLDGVYSGEFTIQALVN